MSHSLDFARRLADQVASALQPHCTRLLVAGSIRREAEQVGDLELVVIPRVAAYREFQAVVNAWPAVRGKANGKYTRRRVAGMELDLFMVSLQSWPCVATIRTGSADFSKALVTHALKVGMRFSDGLLWRGGKALPLVEEEDVFRELGLAWVEPRMRTGAQALRRLA